MKFISDYYNKLLKYKKFLFTLNSSEDIELVIKTIKDIDIEKVSIVSNRRSYLYKIEKAVSNIDFNIDIKLFEYTKDEYINIKTNTKLNSIDYVDVIIFNENLSYDDIVSLGVFKPKCILGKIDFNEVDYYSIWSKFRRYSEIIYMDVTMPSGKIEHVNWEKGDSNIEISIIFPVYNVEKYLDKCIETVTKWKANYLEFIFINDGSTDNSSKILKNMSLSDPRIKVIDKKNGGCASARKLGLEKANGKYVGFIDPDDYIDTDMFEQLHKRALLGSYQVCYCGYNEYYEDSKTVKRVTDDAIHWPYTEGVRDEIEIKKLIMYLRVAIWRGIYLKSMLDENDITFNEEFKRFDDLPFKIEVFSKAKSVVAIPEYMYYYRLQRPGQDVSCSDERLYVHFDIFNYIDKKDDILKDSRTRDYIQISKIQTHLYAMDKIDNKYFKTYVKKMKKDIRKNMNPLRNLIITKAYLGNKIFLRINMINIGLCKLARLKARNIKGKDKNVCDKLKKLY